MTVEVKREQGIIHAIAECRDCGWRSEDYQKAREIGRKHAKEFRHCVAVEIGWVILFDAREEKGK